MNSDYKVLYWNPVASFKGWDGKKGFNAASDALDKTIDLALTGSVQHSA